MPTRMGLRVPPPECSSPCATRPSGSPAFGPGTSSGHHSPRVVVLGGGFGGLYAAVRLEQLMWPRGNKPQVGAGGWDCINSPS